MEGGNMDIARARACFYLHVENHSLDTLPYLDLMLVEIPQSPVFLRPRAISTDMIQLKTWACSPGC